MPRTALAAVLALTIAVATIWASQIRYQSGIDVVGFNVAVVERTNAPVTGLTIDDFELREDGVLQNVTYFNAGADEQAVPLHIGLMFDTSESMEKDLSFAR